MDEVLFQVTKEHLETGLRGYPVGYCVTSTVHPEKGLFYCEHPLDSISGWEPEKVIFLLLHGYEGSFEEIAALKANLQERAKLSRDVVRHIRLLPKKGHPMALYAAALLIAGVFEGTGDYQEDCLNLIAKIPEITAVLINDHAGWSETVTSQPELGYMENFAQMLNLPRGRSAELSEVFRLFNILHYDHGGGNLSAFVGKAVASGLEDMYGSISAAMNALAGPRHGGANQECLNFLQEALQSLGDRITEADVEKFVRDRLANKQLVYGFGHAVLRVEDPRATVQYDFAEKHYSHFPLVQLALLMRKAGSKVLKENPKIANPYPNVDAISGTLLTVAGFPYPEYYTVLFGMARVVGIAIQIVYERCLAREGKGIPIYRPKYPYKAMKR